MRTSAPHTKIARKSIDRSIARRRLFVRSFVRSTNHDELQFQTRHTHENIYLRVQCVSHPPTNQPAQRNTTPTDNNVVSLPHTPKAVKPLSCSVSWSPLRQRRRETEKFSGATKLGDVQSSSTHLNNDMWRLVCVPLIVFSVETGCNKIPYNNVRSTEYVGCIHGGLRKQSQDHSSL